MVHSLCLTLRVALMLYHCYPPCRRSRSPASACTVSPGPRQTSQETAAQRRSQPGSRGPSSLPHSALAAAGCTHTTLLVKAWPRCQQFRRAEGKPTYQKQREMILFLLLALAPLCCNFTYLPGPPTCVARLCSYLVFSFESMHSLPVNDYLP